MRLVLVLLIGSMVPGWAQEGVTPPSDKSATTTVKPQERPPTMPTPELPDDLEALKKKIESEAVTGVERKVTNEFKAATDKAYEQEASAMVGKYYQALLDDDLFAVYELMCSQYRKAVKIQNFLKLERMALNHVMIKDIQFKDGTCGRALVSLSGSAGNRLGKMDLPVKLRIFKEEGKWVVYTNPYQKMGFDLPQAKDVVYPCSF